MAPLAAALAALDLSAHSVHTAAAAADLDVALSTIEHDDEQLSDSENCGEGLGAAEGASAMPAPGAQAGDAAHAAEQAAAAHARRMQSLLTSIRAATTGLECQITDLAGDPAAQARLAETVLQGLNTER
jgi:hypothetical protein